MTGKELELLNEYLDDFEYKESFKQSIKHFIPRRGTYISSVRVISKGGEYIVYNQGSITGIVLKPKDIILIVEWSRCGVNNNLSVDEILDQFFVKQWVRLNEISPMAGMSCGDVEQMRYAVTKYNFKKI